MLHLSHKQEKKPVCICLFFAVEWEAHVRLSKYERLVEFRGDCHALEASVWAVRLGIAESLHAVVKLRIQHALHKCRYFSLTFDKTTTVDYVLWISLYVYIIKNCTKVPLLLCLKRVHGSGSTYNITNVIISILRGPDGFSFEHIRLKLVNFGVDGVNVFQECKTGVAM